MKTCALVTDVPAVLIVIGPEVAPVGTDTARYPGTTDLMVAATPLKSTLVMLKKYWPAMVTVVPTGPLAEPKRLMLNALWLHRNYRYTRA